MFCQAVLSDFEIFDRTKKLHRDLNRQFLVLSELERSRERALGQYRSYIIFGVFKPYSTDLLLAATSSADF